jgi:hypothetical protein
VGGQSEHSSSDVIRTFCAEFVLRYAQSWPAKEEVLAKEFVTHFALPPFLHAAHLAEIGENLKIRFVKENLPDDLLGSNFNFAGQRRIAVSDRLEHVGMKEHTFLHEVRELLEYEFREFGYPTVEINTDEIEFQADQFAMSAILCSTEETWNSWTKSAFEMQSRLGMLAAIALIFVGRVVCLLNASYCASHTDLERSHPGRPTP